MNPQEQKQPKQPKQPIDKKLMEEIKKEKEDKLKHQKIVTKCQK